ncbi:MAG: hypothetical protein NWE92_06625 [Candidatus Bathyarchaeota archaeon]|nr:hypothetical protein [Candidatus Bathyarchaeota archaeon]
MNSKGQFSIIAALLVAVVLVAAVVTTYSAIRYSSVQEQPQLLSAIDETNLGLKEILGFTVGYYGSVLKVTGNVTYAQQLARTYLQSGLNNIGEIRPEWGATVNLTGLTLNADWFSADSYSQGSMDVNYDLIGLGISGINYNASARLDVQLLNSSSLNQAKLAIRMDDDTPLINLGKDNLKFYRYNYVSSAWELAEPTNIASYANGTYTLDFPQGVDSSYVIQVQDVRGLMVIASSFSQYTSTVTWNSTGYQPGIYDFVDNANANVTGTHSNFNAQQSLPDSAYDTLTEALSGTFNANYSPNAWTPQGNTALMSGSFSDLQTDNSAYMQLRSYPTAYGSSYNTIGFDSQNSAVLTSQGYSITWTHTTGSGSERLLLVSIDIFARSTTPASISGVVTYDGVTMSQVATVLYNTNPQIRSYVYYLVNPSPGTKTITANFNGATYAIGGSITYTNVNQTTPILASSTNTGLSSAPSTAYLTASGTNNKLLYGHLGTQIGTYYTVNDPVTQTNRWSDSGSYYIKHDGTYYYAGRGSDKSVTSGSVYLSWNPTSTVGWTAIAALIQPSQVGTAYACSAEFRGTSNTDSWNSLAWTLNAASTATDVAVTYQLYNYITNSYVTVGNGYLTDTLGTSDTTKTQTITSSFNNFRDGSGNWKVNVTATKTTSVQFDLKLDLIQYSPNENNYALNLQEQWLTVNASNVRQDLCIKTGAFSSESLVVQVLHGGSWQNLMTLRPNYFNNASLVPYIDSSTLTIRFVGSNDATDPNIDTWNIDSVYIKDQPDVLFLLNLQESTITLQVLQNGTIQWLGQNLALTTQTLPIPPVPVKAIHVNQTINGVNVEVPFQIEDWASNYKVPLCLTSNTTVFSNRQMIVFQINCHVSEFTISWDGRDVATQTPLAYTNRYFTTDNPEASTLSSGNVTLLFTNSNVKATVGSTSSTATFMRINGEASIYGASFSYVIHHGIVRDIVMQEAEFSGGVSGAYDLYANIVLTLPANTKYYTYQLTVTFAASSQTRALYDLSPIQLTSTATSPQTQTEDGTLAGFPLLYNGTGTFVDTTVNGWTPHHFNQFITNNFKGAGLFFPDLGNQKLYTFDSFPASTSLGALKTGSTTLELLPVSCSQVQFQTPYEITWQGAVSTFDTSTPVCRLYDDTTPTGLWLLVEYPPTLTLTAKS